jgi:hypothetical protein
MAEQKGHAVAVPRLRAVVAEQLRAAAGAAGPEPEPELAGAGGEQLVCELIVSAGKGAGAAVARLLAAGVDPNALVAHAGETLHTCSTALVAAAGNGHLAAARLLLDGGADPSRNPASWSEHIFLLRPILFLEPFRHNFAENGPQDLKMVQKDASRDSTQSVIKISS